MISTQLVLLSFVTPLEVPCDELRHFILLLVFATSYGAFDLISLLEHIGDICHV